MFSWDSSAFSMIQWMLAIWSLVPPPFLNPAWTSEKFTVHILLKPGLENFEHFFASVWDECNCVVVWTFFHIAFLWDWNENWPFPVFFFSLCKATLHRSKIQDSFLYLLLFSDMILDKSQCLDPRCYQLFISSSRTSPISFLHILFSLMFSGVCNLHLSSSPLISIHLKLQQSVPSHFSFGQSISGQSPQICFYIRM